MDRTLVVITRQSGPTEIGNGPAALYRRTGHHLVDEHRSIWVFGQRERDQSWGALLTPKPILAGRLLGIAYHNVTRQAIDTGIVNVLSPAEAKFLSGNYTDGNVGLEKRKYEAHKLLAQCVRDEPQCAEAQERFDLFWNMCFADHVLEALIQCLKAHAISKSVGTPIVNVDGLGAAHSMLIDAGGTEEIQALKTALQNHPAEAYEALRNSLISAIKAREVQKRGWT